MKIIPTKLIYGYSTGGLVSQRNNNTQNRVLFTNCISPPDTINISFKKSSEKPLYISDLREIPDLHCGCCGKTMIKNSKVNHFMEQKIYYPAAISLKRIKQEHYFNESKASPAEKEAYAFLKTYASIYPKLTISEILSKRNVKMRRQQLKPEVSEACEDIRELTKLIAHNSKYMVNEISKLNPDFHKVEKKVFKELQWLSKKYPNLTFNDILNIPQIYNYHLRNLESKQIAVLNEVSKVANYLDEPTKEKVLKATKIAKKIFKEESREIFHKRSRVISEYHNILAEESDRIEIQELFEILDYLPNSSTDVDAFMIKGAQKSSNSIVEILIGRQRNTFEHVKPHRRENDNGPNSIYNYIGLCGKCNAERQREEYDKFIKKHPEMPENEQLQINQIIYYINQGILTGYDDYPPKIAKALDIESKGNIKINIDKLDLKKAKENRKIRQNIYVENKKNKKQKYENITI